jgi:hypothetical protein
MSERSCGDCTLCCKVMAVEALGKPAGSWCSHCKPGRGCLIYETRPEECRHYSCLWLTDRWFGEHWKPSRSKLVLTLSEDGIEIRCDPGFPDAWHKEPFRSEIARLAQAGEAEDLTVLVIVGQRMTLVTATGQFDLGVVGPGERIVRELEGRSVVGATVVKTSIAKDGS